MMLMDSGVVCDGTLLHWGNLLKVYTVKHANLERLEFFFFWKQSI